MRWPRSLTRAFDAAATAQRRPWLAFALVAAIAVAVAIVAIPLRDAIARARDDLARNRLVLAAAHGRAAESVTLAHAGAPAKSGDVQAAIDRVLAAHGLRHAPVTAHASDGAPGIVIEAAPFDALVRALDALARDEGVRVVEATLTARIDPGTVRAELVLAR